MFYSKQASGFYDEAVHGDSMPPDAKEITADQYAALMQGQADGKRIVADADGMPTLQDPPPPTFQDLVAANTRAIQKELDRQAAAKGYDNIISACSYAAQAAGAPFQAEGAAFLEWRSDVWTKAYTKLSAVEAGTAVMPTPDEAVAAMPPLVLPA